MALRHGGREWLGDAARPWLHFAHATGMCAEIYATLLEPLADSFNIVASDARGHGSSTLPADPAAMISWRIYRDDLAALLASYGDRSWHLAGHSMGAVVSLELAAAMPGLATGVVMVEPAFVPFAATAGFDRTKSNPMVTQAAKRRDRFANVDEARESWRGRGVFRDWSDADLEAYLRGGLHADAEGVRLACAPAWEAATFAAVTCDLEAAVRDWHGPLTLLHGTEFTTVSQADADTIASLGARVERIDGASHFLPLQHPEAVRAAIRAGTCAAASPLTP